MVGGDLILGLLAKQIQPFEVILSLMVATTAFDIRLLGISQFELSGSSLSP